MEAIEELAQLSDSMRQAASLLADEDVDESSPSSSRRPSTFLNVVALGNVVSFTLHGKFSAVHVSAEVDFWICPSGYGCVNEVEDTYVRSSFYLTE